MRGSALEILGHCHNIRGNSQVMQLLLDGKTQQLSKISLKLVMTNAKSRTTATPYHKLHQTGSLAVGICRRHKAALRTACIDAWNVIFISKSAIFSSISIRVAAKINSH
jgi:hypothetical protein